MASKLEIRRVPNRRVLLVDREHDVQGPLIIKLKKAGFDTLTARRGKDAIAISESESIALLIIDPRLQDMSGAKVGAVVRERQGVPFLFLTEQATSNYESAAIEAGAMNILSKQMHPDDLVTQIQLSIRQADEMANAQRQNEELHRRVNSKINQESFIGALMHQWSLDRKTVRRIVNQFARQRRVSIDDLADIHASHRDAVQELNQEFARRVDEVQPDILIELGLYQTRTGSQLIPEQHTGKG